MSIKEAALRAAWRRLSGERAECWPNSALCDYSSAPGALGPMRKLATELAAARGALDVGFVVTVTPKGSLDLRVRKDGQKVDSKSTANPSISKPARRLRSPSPTSRRCTFAVADERHKKKPRPWRIWGRDVEPHLVAAGVADLDGLDAKIAEARAGCRHQGEGCRSGVAARPDSALTGAAAALREASNGRRPAGPRSETYSLTRWPLISRRLALMRSRVTKAATTVVKGGRGARSIANDAANAQTLADERTRHSNSRRWMRPSRRGMPALPAFPEGVDAALVAARAALAAGIAEKEKVAAEFLLRWSVRLTSEKSVSTRPWATLAQMPLRPRVPSITAQGDLTTAKTDHALHDGRLIELRKLRDAENLAAPRARLLEKTRESCGVARP
jgi:hypothetical protein